MNRATTSPIPSALLGIEAGRLLVMGNAHARFVRVATRMDFVEEFGPAGVTPREEREIAAGGYLVVRRVAKRPGFPSLPAVEGRERVVHHTAVQP